MHIPRLWIAACAAALLAPGNDPVFADPIDPIRIGSRLELFVDDFLIERFSDAARRRMHHPVRREIAVVHDDPWEGNGGNYHAVFRDGDVYRMYYHAWQIPGSVAGETHPLYIGYCESSDGIHWVKPALGIHEFNGSKQNNIVLATIHGQPCHDFSPFIDDRPGTGLDSRYKAVGFGRNPSGLYGFKSADAIHWELLNDGKPIMTGHPFDTQNIAFWDGQIGKYRAYIRDFYPETPRRRGIMTSLSDDFVEWTERVWLDFPDERKEQLYTNQIKPYHRAPHIYIGFPARYVDRGWIPATDQLPEPKQRRFRAKGSSRYGSAVTDALFMSSRDGRTFDRWNEAFLRPGLRTRHNWSYGDNYVAWHVVETESVDDDSPRELSLYATESYFTGRMSRLRRYTLRIDGFISVHAPIEGGEMVTRPFVFEGDRLVLNVSTSAAGSVFVEIQDENGVPLPGFTKGDCHEIFGDSLDRVVTWKADPDLSGRSGQPIRLRFVLKDADLYGFQFQ